MRLIDADALKERLLQISVVAVDTYGMGINRGLDRADTAIDMMPTVDIKTEVAREIIEYLEVNGYLNMTPKGIAELKNKYIGGMSK